MRTFIDPDWPESTAGVPLCDCNQPGIATHPYGHEGFCRRKPWGLEYQLRKIRNKFLQMIGLK